MLRISESSCCAEVDIGVGVAGGVAVSAQTPDRAHTTDSFDEAKLVLVLLSILIRHESSRFFVKECFSSVGHAALVLPQLNISKASYRRNAGW